MTIAVESQFKQLRSSPKKFFRLLQRNSNSWPLRSRCSAHQPVKGMKHNLSVSRVDAAQYDWPAFSVWVFIAQWESTAERTQKLRVRILLKPRKKFLSGYFSIA